MKKLLLIFAFITTLLFLSNNSAKSSDETFNIEPEYTLDAISEETLSGVITKVDNNTNNDLNSQILEILITDGTIKGNYIQISNELFPTTYQRIYQQGDKVFINYIKGYKNEDIYYITDFNRSESLLWLFLIFAGVTLFIGKLYGFRSLIGLIISFVIIFKFLLPQILSGADPVKTAIITSIFIVPITFYLSHGINKKTSIAILGTIISLFFTTWMAELFINLTRLTGFAMEEANFLQSSHPGLINFRGLLLAGIIISGIGVLDDVTVSQASIVNELKSSINNIKLKDLYLKAMNVGHDHIASVVNTLVLVYAGAALPLMLLFVDNAKPISEIISIEFVADEIVRTLVASIGLIMAVPITTLIASWFYTKK